MRYLTLFLLLLSTLATHAQNAQGGYGVYYISMQGKKLPMSIEPYRGGVEIAIIAATDLYPQDFKILATDAPKERKALDIKTSADYRVGNVLITHLDIPEHTNTYYVMVLWQGQALGMAVVCTDTEKWIER